MSNKRPLLIFWGMFLFLILILNISAQTPITSCVQNLPSGDYILNANLTAVTTCLTINWSNVKIDCQGYTITYDSGGGNTAYGINVIYLLTPLSNITIQNCIIQDNSTAGTPSSGIQFTRVLDSYIFNNTIQTNGTTLNYGITLATSSKRNRIINNTLYTNGSGIANYGMYVLTESSDNVIVNNTIMGIGTTTSSAIYLSNGANNNSIINNNLTTISTIAAGNNADPQTIMITSSNFNNISGNYIFAQGAQRSYTVYISTNADSNIINNNTINTNLTAGGTIYSVYVYRSPFTKITNNMIIANGTTGLNGMYLTNAPSTFIQNNTVVFNVSISTMSGVTLSGVSPYTVIKDNNFSIKGGGGINGVSITTSDSVIIQNNSIAINATAITNNGIVTATSPNTLIQNNTISIGGTGSINGVSITTSDSPIVQNNTILINATAATDYGIATTTSPDTVMKNNTISIMGAGTIYGISTTSADSNLIKNNTIYLNGTTALIGVQTTTSPANAIENNTINVFGNGATNYGVYFSSSNNNTAINNSINVTASTPAYGVYANLHAVSGIIEGNTISTYGTGNSNYAVYLTTGSNENIVRRNVIFANGLGTTNYGVYILTCDNNLVESNNITTNGTTSSHGLYIATQSENNTVRYNTIIVNGTTTLSGIYLNTANYNNIIGNNITSNGTTQAAGTTTSNYGIQVAVSSYASEIYNNTIYTGGGRFNYGIYLLTDARNSNISGNTVYSGGTGAGNVGLCISESHYNYIENNTISTSGTTTDYGFNISSSSRYNIIKNNTISTAGTTSHAFDFLYIVAGGYPENNQLISNNLLNISGNDINFETASINNTQLINQVIGNYSFTGFGGLIDVENTSAGKINFLPQINGTNTTFSNKVYIKNNFARIDEYTKELNKSAEITLYNMPINSTELQIIRNGGLCPTTICKNLTSLQAGNVTFNVTEGGNYSINSTSALPTLNLNLPGDHFNTSSQSINFNFTTTDDSAGNLNCNIYINSVLNQTNSSTQNNTLTNFLVSGLAEGNYSWYVECFDSAGNRNVSETRAFSIIISQPSVLFNYPFSDFLNGVDSVELNYAVYDSDLRNMTIWVYGDEQLLNYLENVVNGTTLTYDWNNLFLGQHNWTVISNNGIKNSTEEINYFNTTNLTVNLEAGGDYLENPTVLIQGAISDNSGLVLLSLQTINISIYSNSTSNLVASSNTKTASNGIFNSIFTGLGVDNYTVYATIYYQGVNVNSSTSFMINFGYSTGYNAGFIAGNESGYILGFNGGNITGFILGNTTGFVFGNSTGFNLGNITGFNLGNATGYILGNSTGYILGNATGFIYGNTTGFILGNTTGFIYGNVTGFNLGNSTGFTLGNYTGFILGNITGFYFGNSSGYSLGYSAGLIAGNYSPSNLVLDKIISLQDLTPTNITYNITLRLTNKGGSNATYVNITNSDSGNYEIEVLTPGNSITESYLLNFTRNSTNYNSTLPVAYLIGIDSYSSDLIYANSTQIVLTIPSITTGKQIIIAKNIFYSSENSTGITYNVSSTLYNSGDEDLVSINYIDTDLRETAFTMDINKGDSYLISKLVTIDKAASNTNHQFALGAATIDSLNFYSNRPTVRIPGYGGPADTYVYSPESVYNSTSFDSIIKIKNLNQDIGQNFVVDYWITNDLETVNYSSGQATVYVPSLGETNTTITLTSPSLAGNYRLKALVSYTDGSDVAYDYFIVNLSNIDTGTGGEENNETGQENQTEKINPQSSKGSGAITVTGATIYGVNSEEIVQGKTQELKDGDKINFDLIQENVVYSHSLKITNIQANYATLTIYSEPITIPIYVGEEKKLDLNSDGYYDLYVKLNGIEDKKADIYIKYIHEKIQNAYENTNETSGGEGIKEETSNMEGGVFSLFKKRILQNKSYLLMGLGILILFIILFLIIKIVKRNIIRRTNGKNRLKSIIGKEVYGDNGDKIGRIKEVYIGDYKVYGWMIKLNKSISKKIRKKMILVKQKYIKSIGKIVIIDKRVAEHLEKLDSKCI
jgi:sporulation protein YlmC with PRC-barrel domain